MNITKRDLTFLPCIHKGRNSSIYLLNTTDYDRPAVIKILLYDYNAPLRIRGFANEYQLTKDLNIPGIRNAYEYITIDDSPALILEYIEGETVREAFVKERKNLSDVISASISITGALNNIHSQHIIHKNISSTNIIVNLKQMTGTIIDFGVAARVNGEGDYQESSELFRGSLPYISPEQTGRMNRSVDHRTDLYSLGVVLYEILTGKLPFDTENVSEMVHCHIARNPTAVSEINPEIPQVISDIVAKLMAKNPGDRYQSACGLKLDLEKCLKQLSPSGNIEAFELASGDFSVLFQIPKKLYGREPEIQILLKTLERVTGGYSELLMISGHAGVGKSALISEIHQFVMKKNGYFIKGQHDEYHRNVPYHALIQAFSELVDLMLTESAGQLAEWKTKITKAIGSNGALLTEVIPRLELIVGNQPSVQHPGPAEIQKGFHHVFLNFVKVITQKQHPLVLFIDNLQWADNASLNLLKLLMTGIENQYLLFIGAYRHDEVGLSHPLITTIKDLKLLRIAVKTVYLGNLSVKTINNMVSDILKCKTSYTESLAELIHKKTGGNPLFVIRFFQSIYEEKFLVFDSNLKEWKWDKDQIYKMDITDNVVTLMKQEIVRLPKKTQELLSLAACMGNRFSLKSLAEIAEQSERDTLDCLWPAFNQGLIVPLNKNYPVMVNLDMVNLDSEKQVSIENHFEFLYDRVRKASYSFISRKNRKMFHLKIGRLQLQHTPESELEEKIFDITNHFNEGFQYLQDDHEKLKLVELNLIAGRKAKRTEAYQSAIWYLSMAIGMLSADRWDRHYDLTVNLYVESVEAEYLSTNFERAELLSSEVLQHVRDVLTRIKVYELRVLFYTIQNQNFRAIESGIEALNILKIPLPTEQKKIKSETEQLIRDVSGMNGRIEELAQLPVMYDKVQLAAMRILMSLATPAHRVNPCLLKLIICRMVLMSVNHGNSPLSAFAYGWYGALLCRSYSDIEKGYSFGQISIKVLKLLKATELESRVLFLFNVFVRHWKEHIRETVKALEHVYQSGIQTGELKYTYYSAVHYCIYLFYAGGRLDNIFQKQTEYLERIKQYRLEFHSYLIKIWGQTILNLQGGSGDPCRLTGKMFDESKMLPLWIEQNNLVLVFSTFCCRTMLQYLFGNYTDAIKSACLGKKYEKGGEGYIYLVEHYFYYALALLANYRESDSRTRKESLKKVASIQKKMKQWAYYAPMNYKNKYYLIEAEKARVSGKIQSSITNYGNAIKEAREHGYINEEAHDFNNMLGVIIGYTQIAMMEVNHSDTLYCQLQEILKAAQRSAVLTRQLLTFARRQTARPIVMDLNETVSGMVKMLRCLIGEDIELIWTPGNNLCKVRMDPSQIDQILANLVVNSRDAIRGHGIITLKTGNKIFDDTYCTVHVGHLPGNYVLLEVNDTGAGMSKETMEHIFEPFFTTKEMGKGTGLGLATVYGIVRQNNGFINVHSEPGKGTSFKIYLPSCETEIFRPMTEMASNKLAGGIETVLVTEDEETNLNICRTILEKVGYTVLAARTPEEAIHLAENHNGNIHLLITDVVMPGMNGIELWKRLYNIRPGLKCLYISGYTANVISHNGLLDKDINFIQKPFLVNILAEKVRDILDAKENRKD